MHSFTPHPTESTQPERSRTVPREVERARERVDTPGAAPATKSRPGAPYVDFYRGFLWPTWERAIRGRETPTILAAIERSQWLPREGLDRLQLDSLRALLAHAGAHVPYYRELFRRLRFDARDVTSVADLNALPVLTREIVRERYQELISEVPTGPWIPKGTSGSTGAPLKFEYSLESECWRQATRIRGYSWAGYRPGGSTFYYWANVARPTGAKALKIQLDRALKREVFVDSMLQDEASQRDALDRFRRAKPDVVVCYTQSCASFARFILSRGLRDWPDIPVICGAEAVLAADRAVLERAFGPVFETYGSRETMLIGAECEAHDGMHVSEENLVVEITRDGTRVGDGDSGDVTITDLHNKRMPFIRYVNGDVAALCPVPSVDRASGTILRGSTVAGTVDERCACGRSLRKIARVDGRRADTLTAGDGTPLPGIVVHVLFSDARREVVRQFQAVQKPSGNVVLKVVRGAEWCETTFAATLARLRDYLRGRELTVEFCEAITPSPNGKMRTIVVERS